ncbi:CRISPR-associated helicase Cas3' [Jutongia sp.]|uniref:CRISPR-associated helicase Cas3' n=1 Tax=Jutongia sp. TaxID=2944204 RepID=UPI00307AA9A6
MNYIAHKDGDREQSMVEHLSGTAKLAGEFAGKFGMEDWGFCCGMLHDVGKYSKEFQNKIKNNSDERVDHSTAGTKLCYRLGGSYSLLCYCIAGHHSGLPDYDRTLYSSGLRNRFKKSICKYEKYAEEIKIPPINTRPLNMTKVEEMDYSLSVFIRMIYSCLVDADFLDTESFMNCGKVQRIQGETMTVLLNKMEKYIMQKGWTKNVTLDSVNGRRTEILKKCMQKGKEEKGIFRLTVPTGGGKTIASLAFALRHAVEHGMDRVIYVIPYTSIIEQNAQVFREILGYQNVLENHCNVEYKDTEDFRPMQLASENWDKPIIVTTNVQFFESLYSNRSTKCRKIHNIANSVIIFDEAQMLPVDYLKPCLNIIKELVNNYEVSAVLCTATQPAFDRLLGEQGNIVELCPRVREQFHFFKRVHFQNMESITENQLVECLCREKRALCIVNTRGLAQSIYENIKGEGIFHLSTSMYPKHRKRVLENIDKIMKDRGNKCILIATSLVEAGVDLDFDTVYRQIAGIDSMIQAAGRCNREGKRKSLESKVYIFDIDGQTAPQNQKLPISIANGVLEDYKEIQNLDSIREYFDRLYKLREGSLDKKDILGKFKKQRYNFATVGAEFRLIEEEQVTLFIPYEPEAKELLQDINNKGISRERMRMIHQFCVQIRRSICEKMYAANMIRPICSDIEDFYELTMISAYSEEKGLDLSVDYGCGIFA